MMRPSIFGENLFDEMMSFPFEDNLFGRRAKNLMKTDVKEKDGMYEFDIDLPGFKKEEISVSLDNGYLTISAVKGMDKEETKEDGKYIRRERYSGQCTRSFYVGDGVSKDDIKAKYEEGILKLTLPKEEPKEIENKKYISIEG
jgi:HSP20 family protein